MKMAKSEDEDRFGVLYNDKGFKVARLNDQNAPVFRSLSKSECIKEAQRRNGWAVDGNELTYGQQAGVGRRAK